MGIRLASVNEVKAFLGKTDNDSNVTINNFISDVSGAIESYCGFDFEKKRRTENYNSDGVSIFLRNFPVSEEIGDTFSLIVAGTPYTRDVDFQLDNKTGIIVFPYGVAPTSATQDDCSINYTSGYVVKNAAPVFPVESIGLTFDTSNPIFYETPVSALTSADASVAGNVNGTVIYKVTLANSVGETELGSSSSITVANSQVLLSNIPVPPSGSVATKRKIYRTKDGGTTFFLLTTLNDVTTTTFTDNVTDGSISVDYYSTANFDILDGVSARAVYGTDYTRSIDGISNLSLRPLIIKQKKNFVTMTKNDLESFDADFSGECLYGIIDSAGNIFTLAKDLAFLPDDNDAVWVNRSTLTPPSDTAFYLTKDQLSNKLEYFQTQAKRRTFGIVVVIMSGSEGIIKSATLYNKKRDWTSTADDDTTLVPDELKSACIQQVAYQFKYRKELGLDSRSAPDGSISLSFPDRFMPSVLRILSKYRRVCNYGG